MDEVNWVLQSEVSCVETPYLEIHLVMRVSEHVAAAMARMGNAYSQQEKNQTKMLIFSPKSCPKI